MVNKKQSPVRIIILIAIIGVATFFILNPPRPPIPTPPLANWTCEECGYRFTAPRIEEGPIECRACRGNMAVRTLYFHCPTCAQPFEGYRTKPPLDLKALVGIYKVPGGEWIAGFPPEIACPICGRDEGLELIQPEN